MRTLAGDLWEEVRVYGSDGINLCETGSEIASCTLPSTGTYSILAYDGFNGTLTGDYYLYLQRLNNPGSPVSIAFGQTLAGSIPTPAEMDTYTFTANAGDKVLVRMSKSSGDIWPEIRVYSPDGIKLCETHSPTTAEIASCTLTDAGTYIILVDDGFNGTFTGNYYLYLQRLNYPGTPVSILSIAASDGWILESTENSNVGGSLNSTATTFRLGDDAAKKQYRDILSFNTGASLPDNAIIIKVTLKVKRQGIIGGGNPVTMFQGFMVDIKKGFFGTAALQASDFQTKANKTYGPFNTVLSGGWYSLDLTSGKAYINQLNTLSGLTQIRLRFNLDDNNNAVANYLSLFSGNAPAASRPQLIIQYYIP
jgi:hypothetical protein